MDQIIEHVLPENKEWVAGLSGKNIADILNTLALVPHMKDDNEPVAFIQPKLPESEIAAVKGLAGETNFYNIMLPYKEYEVINVAKQGKAGDFVIKWQSFKTNRIYKILVDVKNYSKSVPTLEIDKFYRDVNLNVVDGGMLLSFNSKITGINKIIEIKEVVTDSSMISAMFVQSNTPLLIIEVIKLLFHHIEIKDISKNSIKDKEEIIYRINSLGDSIQTFKDCRDTLQSSKNDIEKSLSNIFLKIMACEFELINKINNINSSLIEKKSDSPKTEYKVDVVKSVLETFGAYVLEDTSSYLYSIYNNCSNEVLESKKIWRLKYGEKHIDIKFQKAGLTAIFSEISPAMEPILNKLTMIKKINTTAKSISIKISNETISYVVELISVI